MPTVDNGIHYTPNDWVMVWASSREIGRFERPNKAVAQWAEVVRFFRRVEQGRFYKEEPTEADRENHRALLHLLIGLGRNCLLEIQSVSDQQLVGYGFTRADLEAAIADLEDTFFMFYTPDLEPARTAELQRKIFGA